MLYTIEMLELIEKGKSRYLDSYDRELLVAF
jgi:hypothetical protein